MVAGIFRPVDFGYIIIHRLQCYAHPVYVILVILLPSRVPLLNFT